MKTLVKTTKAQFIEVLGNVAVAFKTETKKQGLFTVKLFKQNGEVVAKQVKNATGGVGYHIALA